MQHTLLIQAAMNGHQGVVKMLLDRVDVNAGSVRKLRLDRGLQSGFQGLSGRTADTISGFRVIRCD